MGFFFLLQTIPKCWTKQHRMLVMRRVFDTNIEIKNGTVRCIAVYWWIYGVGYRKFAKIWLLTRQSCRVGHRIYDIFHIQIASTTSVNFLSAKLPLPTSDKKCEILFYWWRLKVDSVWVYFGKFNDEWTPLKCLNMILAWNSLPLF